MFFACENFDQNGEKFINMGKRFNQIEQYMSIIEKGFWKNYVRI